MLPKGFSSGQLWFILVLGSLPYLINTLWMGEQLHPFAHSEKFTKVMMDLSLAMMSAIPFWLVIEVMNRRNSRVDVASKQAILFRSCTRRFNEVFNRLYFDLARPLQTHWMTDQATLEAAIRDWRALLALNVDQKEMYDQYTAINRWSILLQATFTLMDVRSIKPYSENFSVEFNMCLNRLQDLCESIVEEDGKDIDRLYNQMFGYREVINELAATYAREHRVISPLALANDPIMPTVMGKVMPRTNRTG